MANYKKYAEELIGNWETGQYEPQRTVTQNIYQTNLNKLTNDFNTLKDKLARNFENAQLEYANALDDVQNQSFNRVRNANIDLANRGLSGSGVGNLVTQADVQEKGQDIDRALADLLAVNNASIEGLTEGTMKLGENQTSLAGDLAADMGGITDQEAANAQQYANLIAGIGNSAANRAASRRRSGGGSSKQAKKDQEEADELKRRRLIADTLSSTELSDTDKVAYLYQYLDVPINTAKEAVTGYNNNIILETTQPRIANLENKLTNIQDYRQARRDSSDSLLNKIITDYNILSVPGAMEYHTQQSLNKARKDISGLTYTDIYDLLYGKR